MQVAQILQWLDQKRVNRDLTQYRTQELSTRPLHESGAGVSPIKFIYLEKRNVFRIQESRNQSADTMFKSICGTFDFVRNKLVKYLSNGQLEYLTRLHALFEQVQFRK